MHRHRIDQHVADLLRERAQLLVVERAQHLGAVDRFEQGVHHRGRSLLSADRTWVAGELPFCRDRPWDDPNAMTDVPAPVRVRGPAPSLAPGPRSGSRARRAILTTATARRANSSAFRSDDDRHREREPAVHLLHQVEIERAQARDQRGHPADEAIAARRRDRGEWQQPRDVLRGQDGRAHEQQRSPPPPAQPRRPRAPARTGGGATNHQTPATPTSASTGSPRRRPVGHHPDAGRTLLHPGVASANTCTTAPTVLSICHPGAPRKVSTWTGPLVPAHAIHAADPARRDREERAERSPARDAPRTRERGRVARSWRSRRSRPARRRPRSPPAGARARARRRRARRRGGRGAGTGTGTRGTRDRAAGTSSAARRPQPQASNSATTASSATWLHITCTVASRTVRPSSASIAPRVIGGYSTAKSAYGVPRRLAMRWKRRTSPGNTVRRLPSVAF